MEEGEKQKRLIAYIFGCEKGQGKQRKKKGKGNWGNEREGEMPSINIIHGNLK